MKSVRSRLTYANVVATLALFMALAGGTAFAASQLGRESVGTRQLKKEAVTPAKLSKSSKSALTGAKGDAGATGAQGPQGPKGEQGVPGSVASPSSLFRTKRFSGSLTATIGLLATLDFTPAASGEALVRARGFCDITPDAANPAGLQIAIGKNTTEVQSQPIENAGLIELTKQTPNGSQAYGISAERTLAVTAGSPESISLFGVGTGAATSKFCQGTLTIQAVF